MDVFELCAKLTLKSDDYETGLDRALGAAKNAGKTIGKALGAATAAVTAFAGASVKTGAEFDSAMSQVAATLGMTVDAIANNLGGAGDTFDALRDKAREMGGSTIFSATEAAEGLNILAMSGYDAEESIGMVEDVLHLAAAGAMDMASAASYVTDTMKGFNDATKDSAYYADLMAKGATLANTSVAELGDAMSSGAAGAAAYNQSAESMTVALLRLAEMNETGSAAGTALAATMKNLYTPTDQAKKVLNALGVATYDESGAARDFNTVVNELSDALSQYSEEEANAYKNTIFGIQGLAAYNKMTVTSTEKQLEWAEALAEASDGIGEAARQYDTMTKNLDGALKGWGSAVSDLQIEISDQLTPTLSEFINFGTSGVQKLTAAFQEGGLSGAMDTLGDVLTDGLEMVFDTLPKVVEAGGQLLIALTEGVIKNLPILIQGTGQLIETLWNSLKEAAPGLLAAGSDLLSFIVNGIMEGLPQLAESAVALMSNLGNYLKENLPTLIESGLQTIKALTASFRENAGIIVDGAIGLALALGQGLIDAIPAIVENVPEIVSNIANIINDNAPKVLKAGWELIKALVKGLIDALPVIWENMPKIIAAIWDTITAVNWINLGGKIVTGLANGVKNMGSLFKEAGKDLVERFWNIFRPIPNEMTSLGKNIIQGLINGIKAMASAAANSIKEIATSIVSIFSKETGVHSPSTVFAGIGKNLVLGLEQGWDREYGNFEKQLGQVGDSFDFGTRTVNFAASGVGQAAMYGGSFNSYPATPTQADMRPLDITLTLDGRTLARTMWKYNREQEFLHGPSLVGVW